MADSKCVIHNARIADGLRNNTVPYGWVPGSKVTFEVLVNIFRIAENLNTPSSEIMNFICILCGFSLKDGIKNLSNVKSKEQVL